MFEINSKLKNQLIIIVGILSSILVWNSQTSWKYIWIRVPTWNSDLMKKSIQDTNYFLN